MAISAVTTPVIATHPGAGKTAPPNRVQLPEGLGSIQGARELQLPPHHDAPVMPHHRGALNNIVAAADPHLNALTGKADKIRAAMTAPDIPRLEARLEKMDARERKAVKDLLHFSFFSRGSTTPESRVQIRTILAEFVANGGNVADANALKGRLKLQGAQAGLAATLGEFQRMSNPMDRLADAQSAAFILRRSNADAVEGGRIDALTTVALDARSDSENTRRLHTRTVLSSCLAQGMSLDSAETLKAKLNSMPARDVAGLATDIVRPDVAPFKALSRHLINPDSDTPREDFAQVRNLIVDFPAVPERASRYELCDFNVSISRDVRGALQFGNVSAGLVRVGTAGVYPRLDADAVAAIKASFVETAGTKYSRMGAPLDMMGAFVATNRQRALDAQPLLVLADFAKTYLSNGTQAVERYGRGDCIALAEKMKDGFAQIGVAAYVAGYWNSDLTRQRLGNDNFYPDDGPEQTGRMTHADVLIPYTNEAGEERVLLLTPGMGNVEPDKWFMDLEANDPNVTMRRVSGTGGSVDTSALQKAQFGMLTNLQLTNTAWEGNGPAKIFGIDLVAGKVYLNSGATKAMREAHSTDVNPDQTAMSFDYRAAFARPGEEVTIWAWSVDREAYEERQITRLESLGLFLTAVQEQFEQPPVFIANTMALLTNEAAYKSDVIWPSVQDIHRMNG